MTLPCLSPARRSLVELVAPAQTTRLLASCRETSRFTVLNFCKPVWPVCEKKHSYLVYGLDDPVDARITANGLVLRVDEDDLEIFVGRVLVDPVGV